MGAASAGRRPARAAHPRLTDTRAGTTARVFYALRDIELDVGVRRARRCIRVSTMHIGNRIAVILLVVLSSATASSGANYIRPESTLPPAAALTATENGATSRNGDLGELERQREPLRPKVADTADKTTLAEKKTLALLLLMLRDGRGAR
jgi:hypothetical protein